LHVDENGERIGASAENRKIGVPRHVALDRRKPDRILQLHNQLTITRFE